MEFEITSYVGVGKIQLGLSRSEIRKGLGIHPSSFYKNCESKVETDHFEALGVLVYYNEQDVCNAIEFGDPSNPTLKQESFIGKPFKEVLEKFKILDPDLEIDESGLTSYQLGIGIYAPYAGCDPQDPVEGVLVFENGYFDEEDSVA